ncbi:MAG TPA: hypothetical protein DCR10_03770 [Acidimicrobiaceae bacterium]|nr:hypothetical protein [Acidimicrobiaceae bacterium]
MAKNNYLHMKLRESREEIARLKEELEASELASLERERETAGKAAEQIEREQEAARTERARVLEQLEVAEADREQVANQLREAEERQQQERERHQTRTRLLVAGSLVLAGLVVALVSGAFSGDPEVVVVPTTVPATTLATNMPTTTVAPSSTISTMTTIAPSTSEPTEPTEPTVTVATTTQEVATTTEPVRVTTSIVPSETTTTLEPTLPVDPEAEEPAPEIDEVAVLTDDYWWWETSERVQVLQIVLGMDADWTYGPATYERHLQALISREIQLSYLPVPPTTTAVPTTTIVTVEMLLPGQQVQDFKHSGLSDEWIFFGRAGTSVQIQMTSSHFDTYLEVRGPLGEIVAMNDDHLGTNSFVSVQLCETGTYKIYAGSFGYGNLQTGQYSMLLSGGEVIFDALLQKCEAATG